jgi:DNA-binding transcriptional LysR family regulator
MPLNFRQLTVVRAVAKQGSVTGAADALGISQPAVSMTLRDSAAAAGFALFVRRRGRLQPTMETAALIADLDRIVDGVDRVNRMIEELRDARVGAIHIAATPTLADNLLPRAVARFQAARPNVQITIQSMDNISVLDRVHQEQVDLGLILSPVTHVEARQIDLRTDDLICVVHPAHPLAGRDSVTPRDLAPYPLISFSRTLPLGALVERSFRAAGVPRRIALEVNQSSVACALVRAGAGVAITDPFWFLEDLNSGLVRLALRPRTSVVAQLLVPRAAPLSRPARLFVETIRDTSGAPPGPRAGPAGAARTGRQVHRRG